MPVVSIFRRMPRLTVREVARFVEAVVALTLAWTAIRFLPFRMVMRTTRFGSVPTEQSDARFRTVVLGVRQAVKRAARRLPWTIVCFPEGLAAHWMLRRRGMPCQLHYGLRPSVEKLSAHIWVTLAGDVVVGEEAEDPHHCVAIFPQQAA